MRQRYRRGFRGLVRGGNPGLACRRARVPRLARDDVDLRSDWSPVGRQGRSASRFRGRRYVSQEGAVSCLREPILIKCMFLVA